MCCITCFMYFLPVYSALRPFYQHSAYNLHKKRVKGVPCFSGKISIFGRIFEKKHSINLKRTEYYDGKNAGYFETLYSAEGVGR